MWFTYSDVLSFGIAIGMALMLALIWGYNKIKKDDNKRTNEQ